MASPDRTWTYPEGDVAGDALVEAILGKDAKGGGKAALEVLALLVLVVKLERLGEAALFRKVVAELLFGEVSGLVGVDGGSHCR